MSKDELRKRLDAPYAKRLKWYSIQLLLARSLGRAVLRKAKAGKNQAPAVVPEPEEILSETVVRVLDGRDRYVWDGQSPSTFDEFFAKCMCTTVSYFRAKARSRITGEVSMQRATVPFTVSELSESLHRRFDPKDSNVTLAAAIAETRTRGVMLDYVKNLDSYVLRGATTKDIASDLGVEVGTVSSIRSRLKRIIDDADQS